MHELPYWRVLMHREAGRPNWQETQRDHADAIEEMRGILRAGREVSNREFAMHERTRIDNYRGRKDSALALHYLWRVGEAMVIRRERFERVYALTERVAPPEALREVDPEEADDVLLLKNMAADGLIRYTGVSNWLRRTVTPAEMAARRERWLSRRQRDRGPGRGLALGPARAGVRCRDPRRARGRAVSPRSGRPSSRRRTRR